MPAIKNIIFDLGGVLFDIDFKKTADAFRKLGAGNFESLYSQNAAHSLFEELETGKISPENFYARMQQFCIPGTTAQQVKDAWNEILIGFRMPALDFLASIKNRFNIFLLSNTNQIHKTRFEQMLQEATGHVSLDQYFLKAYYSHIMQQRKPYPATYHFVLDDAGIAAADTLFIDDSSVNITGAQEAGLQTHLLLASERVEMLGL